MQYIIFDLEATCWQGFTPGWRQEVIEIGALKITPFGEADGKFHQMVKPTEHPGLSSFCKELTGISQEEIDPAGHFPEIVHKFRLWLDDSQEECLFSAWGHKDELILQAECAYHDIDDAWLEPYIDLKAQYHHLKKLKRKQGLLKTLDKEGMPFEGDHHRAMSDAENLSKLFVKYIDEWQF